MWIFDNQKKWNLNAAIWIQQFSDYIEIAFPDNWLIRVHGEEKEAILKYINGPDIEEDTGIITDDGADDDY